MHHWVLSLASKRKRPRNRGPCYMVKVSILPAFRAGSPLVVLGGTRPASAFGAGLRRAHGVGLGLSRVSRQGCLRGARRILPGRRCPTWARVVLVRVSNGGGGAWGASALPCLPCCWLSGYHLCRHLQRFGQACYSWPALRPLSRSLTFSTRSRSAQPERFTVFNVFLLVTTLVDLSGWCLGQHPQGSGSAWL